MNSNEEVLVVDYASFIESDYMNKISTDNLAKSKYVVNTQYSHLIDKIIIINLPVEVPIEKLSRYNQVISRFPTVDGVKLDPYELPKNRNSLKVEDYSLLILNKDMLLDMDNLDVVANNNFLLGIDTIIDNYITLAGYILLKNKLEEL